MAQPNSLSLERAVQLLAFCKLLCDRAAAFGIDNLKLTEDDEQALRNFRIILQAGLADDRDVRRAAGLLPSDIGMLSGLVVKFHPEYLR